MFRLFEKRFKRNDYILLLIFNFIFRQTVFFFFSFFLYQRFVFAESFHNYPRQRSSNLYLLANSQCSLYFKFNHSPKENDSNIAHPHTTRLFYGFQLFWIIYATFQNLRAVSVILRYTLKNILKSSEFHSFSLFSKKHILKLSMNSTDNHMINTTIILI